LQSRSLQSGPLAPAGAIIVLAFPPMPSLYIGSAA
jgi:hypothetical protein